MALSEFKDLNIFEDLEATASNSIDRSFQKKKASALSFMGPLRGPRDP